MGYYKCELVQVTNEQGYIENDFDGKSLTKLERKYIYNEGSLSFDEIDKIIKGDIIVKKTINPYIVKEIITGILIPVLNSYKNTLNNSFYTKYPFGKIHTYIRIFNLKNSINNSPSIIKKGFDKVTDYNEILTYKDIHPYKKLYKEELLYLLKRGKSKLEKKELLDNKKNENKQKVKELIRKIEK